MMRLNEFYWKLPIRINWLTGKEIDTLKEIEEYKKGMKKNYQQGELRRDNIYGHVL